MNPPRFVLDTNVLLSAMLFQTGTLVWLRHSWQSNKFVPLVSRETTEELLRVLTYPKFVLTAEDRHELLNDYLPWCETISVPAEIAVPECRDPADRPFLKLARFGEADALVTGDRDLLTLVDDFVIPIPTAAQLLDRYPAIVAPRLS